ncbi:MAG: hypothetical protein V3S14_04090 [Anaerolineae bacterium]
MNPPDPVAPTIEPVVGTLRVADGRRLKDAVPCAIALNPPSQAARARRDERLFLLLDVTGPVSSHLCRELREVVAQTYWSATGSITAALRLAAAAANRYLFQANSSSVPSDQYRGGLVCAVLRDEDIFILQAGPACAYFFHQERLECFSRDEELSPLGAGRLADARLHHAYVGSGDKLLLSSPGLARTIDDTGLVRVLARVGVEEILEGLEQVGAGADFAALLVRWPLPGEAPTARKAPPPISRLKTLMSLRAEDAVKPRRLPWWRRREKPPVEPSRTAEPYESPPPEPLEVDEPAASLTEALARAVELPSRPAEPYEPPPPEPPEFDDAAASLATPFTRAVEPHEPPPPEPVEEVEERVFAEREYPLPVPVTDSVEPPPPEPPRELGPDLGERIGDGVRSAGRGVAAAGGVVAGGASTLFRRMLPDPKRRGRRQASALRPHHPRTARPVPQENRMLMMTLAIGIPLVLAVTVALTYRSFGADARFRGLVEQAEEAATLAQVAGSTSESSRPHWGVALESANAAVELRPDDQVAAALQAQAQTALDSLDGIVRLHPVLLRDFGPGTVPRRLVIHGQMIFVLDPAGGWVSRLTLNQTGDSVIEPENIFIVRTGQSIKDGTVGGLVDFVWVDLAGGRQTSGLLILEQDGALVSYDPAWEGEGGALQLKRSFLGMPPESPRVVDIYDGRLYVLDTTLNQIRRYEPRGDTYPERPDHYFVVPPPRPLADVLDMAIDGYIYLLYADGAILKFLRGNPEAFDVRGLPGNLNQSIALAVDPDSSSGLVYVADRGNGRVVALEQDGNFWAQYYAGGAFDALEAVAVDETTRRMYAISNGRLYVASLP